MHALATWRGRVLSLRVLAALLAASWALASAGAAHAFDWTLEVAPGGGLYPVLALSQGAATTAGGSRHGLVIVRLHGGDLPARVAVDITTPGLRAHVVHAARGSAVLELRPPLEWDVDALRQLRQPRDQLLEATLRGSDGSIHRQHLAVRLHPLDEAPYFVREDGHSVDLGWIFAAYVDPGDPVVDAVLALARRLDPAFDQRHGAAADLRRARAVWAALEQHGLRYADGDPAIARGPVVWSQRVRRPGQVWKEGRANCIDASVLLASVFERLGLQPAIVLVPGWKLMTFRALYFGQAENLDGDIVRGNARLAEWRTIAGTEWNLYIATHEMSFSTPSQREAGARELARTYKPGFKPVDEKEMPSLRTMMLAQAMRQSNDK